MAATHPTTKSIDVGSMFLMDLSVQESEMIGDLQNADNDIVFPASKTISSYPLNEKARSKTKKNYANLNTSNHQQSSLGINNNHHHTSNSIAYHRQENRNDYLGNSLDRLASAIQQHDEDYEQQENIGTIMTAITTTKELPTIIKGNLITTVEPQPPPKLANLSQSSTSSSVSASSSLSEKDSFVSTSSGGESNSLSDSFGAEEDEEEDGGVDVERASATTREDSGVLDMKNLESQYNNSYDIDDFSCSNNDHQKQQPQEHKLLHKEKPISTNLINKSAHNNNNNNISIKRPNKPTKINNTSNHDCSSNNNNHHHHRSQTSKRSILMSASLPIQCPPRQMKKDLGKLKKLDLVDETLSINNDDAQSDQLATEVAQQHDNSKHWNQTDAVDDIEADDIWEQDYNLNHKNHYPIDEYDEENLRADTNPEQLFESIKALARSLHEDAELFGSLPPKRLLESPIHRSLAFA